MPTYEQLRLDGHGSTLTNLLAVTPNQAMNRPTPISVFSDQRRTKSITWSRASCGTQLPVKVPQDFFLARCARPSTRPGPRPWSAPSSPRTQSVSASPPPDGGDAPEPERQPLRSRRTPSASGRTPSAASPVPHTGPRPKPCPKGGASEWPPSPLRCNAFVPFSYVRSAILTDERFLHFQLRQDRTTNQLVKIVSTAREHGTKTICFVTGIPGAGKTLVGLNAVHEPGIRESGSFLSGNGP